MTVNQLHDLLTKEIRRGNGDVEIRVWLPGSTVSIDGRCLEGQPRQTFTSKMHPGLVLVEGNRRDNP